MKTQSKNPNWRNGAARHLLKLVQESLQLMNAYISDDAKCEVLVPMTDGKIRGLHQGHPKYEEVLQTYDALDEYLGQLGSFVYVRESCLK